MNQKKAVISLRELIGAPSAFGNEQGRLVYQKLLSQLDEYPENKVIGISLRGIKNTDASFPRESVISLAKAKRGEKGFYLIDFESRDLIDNWDYAAKAKEQPMLIILNGEFQVIGPELSEGTKELLTFIMKKGAVTTSMVAEKLDISAQNASGKLKKLLTQGLVLGAKEAAESGGLEYNFTAIR